MKTAIIVPYFGTLPNYFQLFLNSCSYNPGFDWIIFTDDRKDFDYPDNVHRIDMTFQTCKALIQQRFDFEISLPAPQKICDYRPAFGIIFQDYLTEYDWWGHCDLDQIFGDLSAFITEEMLRSYDKICSLGHLTLYRNTEENNKVFLNPLNGRARYREVFTADKGFAFDEWLPESINDIYLQSGASIHLQNYGADVNSYRTAFQLVSFNIDNRCYDQSPIKNSIFLWDKGTLTQIYQKDGELHRQTFPYVHLQKRAMQVCCNTECTDSFYIVPNRFVDGKSAPSPLLRHAGLRGLVNTQFVKVKWKSLKYRLKSGDWAFSSVFKKNTKK